MTALPTVRRGLTIAAVLAVAVTQGFGTAQTRITAPDNRYSVEDDVELGRDAAAQAAMELPLLDDARVDDWVARIGHTLVAAIPSEFVHPEFRYTFEVVNQQEINAFALPGGPMFLNRGMIEAAASEGEVAGVMAHEISHVALRHGTAQATKAQPFQIGAIAGQALGALLGGTLGNVVSQGTQFGLGTWFLTYGREYESQSDLLGAQMLARAGYDPREMANMFRTIESQGGGGPQIEWLSSHPNPGNRYEAIVAEARSLRVQGNASTGEFPAIHARLKAMAPAYTAEQIARGEARNGPPSASASTSTPRTVARVERPSDRYRRSRPLAFLALSVPGNWSEVSGDASGVTFAPEGGYVSDGRQLTGFTHGLQAGVIELDGDLEAATDRLIASFARTNPQLRRDGGYTREQIDGRSSVQAALSNVSEVSGQRERIWLTTTRLADGRLLYLIGVAPASEAAPYEEAFRLIRRSVELTGR